MNLHYSLFYFWMKRQNTPFITRHLSNIRARYVLFLNVNRTNSFLETYLIEKTGVLMIISGRHEINKWGHCICALTWLLYSLPRKEKYSDSTHFNYNFGSREILIQKWNMLLLIIALFSPCIFIWTLCINLWNLRFCFLKNLILFAFQKGWNQWDGIKDNNLLAPCGFLEGGDTVNVLVNEEINIISKGISYFSVLKQILSREFISLSRYVFVVI